VAEGQPWQHHDVHLAAALRLHLSEASAMEGRGIFQRGACYFDPWCSEIFGVSSLNFALVLVKYGRKRGYKNGSRSISEC
jgi:hypothetical protein